MRQTSLIAPVTEAVAETLLRVGLPVCRHDEGALANGRGGNDLAQFGAHGDFDPHGAPVAILLLCEREVSAFNVLRPKRIDVAAPPACVE
ncbi:hypothetical protein AncyloWKF20_08635 [Ancylobacter sp. WKF20]|uniref:hypothetical protein n=1 Tax=Ancylobacter sp. WKF20 TaxID=3039801 RepID=UPI0024341D07|nr:hypothetical protein [Ancylobacter sp. WKF20]WGD31869.1 hypothetical protein AncyloWKF20_08635 [Ancylobacter sp. WKF20]